MKIISTRWGWLTLSLGIAALYPCWRTDSYMLFSWIMVICSLNVCWLALSELRLGFTQFLLVGAALLNTAAGTANGLVMAANGGRMPVETINWSHMPSFLDEKEDGESLTCRLLRMTDDRITPGDDALVHFDVPPPRILHGKIIRHQKEPNLAFLDDRETIRVCRQSVVYSKGDAMGFIGTVFLGIPGMILLCLGFLWRKLRRESRAPIER
jgi:hypothetical protein